jgi:hypothetical protein
MNINANSCLEMNRVLLEAEKSSFCKFLFFFFFNILCFKLFANSFVFLLKCKKNYLKKALLDEF